MRTCWSSHGKMLLILVSFLRIEAPTFVSTTPSPASMSTTPGSNIPPLAKVARYIYHVSAGKDTPQLHRGQLHNFCVSLCVGHLRASTVFLPQTRDGQVGDMLEGAGGMW